MVPRNPLVGSALVASLLCHVSSAAALSADVPLASSLAPRVSTAIAVPPEALIGGASSPNTPLRWGAGIESALPDIAALMGGADFDGDGRGDLAMATAGGDVFVALNAGGDLASWPWALVGSVPLGLGNEVYAGMAVADLDGDGLSDLLLYGDAEAPGTCGAAVLSSLGDGNFAAGASLAIVPPASDDGVFGCTEAEVGDYDRDGVLDVAVAYAYQPIDWFNGLLGAVNVFRGAGEGAFEAPALYTLADDPAPYVSFAMASGDFDGDGLLDLGFGSEVRYLSGPQGWRVETLRGDGGGGFVRGTVRTFDCVWCELELARAADLDGDGRDDLLLSPTNPESYPSDYPVLLFRSQEGGTFGAPEELLVLAGTIGLEARDVTADGVPDVLLVGGADHVTLLEGQGDGGFSAPQRFVTGRRTRSDVLVDLDGDGASELVLLSDVPEGAEPVFEIARGAPAGGFELPSVSRVPSGYTVNLAPPADFDGDGNLDVLAIGYDYLELMLGTGDGRFVLGGSTPSVVSAWPMPVADLNGDGRLDLVQAAGDGFAVAIGLSDNTFAPTPSANGRSITEAALGDIDGDGDPDLAVTEWPGDTIDIYLGDGALGFTRAASLAVGVYVSQLILADLSSDGLLDLFVGAEGVLPGPEGEPLGPLVSPLWLGDGLGGFTAGAAIDNAGYSFRAADVDGDGALDLVSPNALSLGDGTGRFAPPEPLPSAGLWQVELADLDGDGFSDLLYQRDGVMVARGGAGGRFEPAQRLSGAWGWLSFATGQFAGSPVTDVVALHDFTTEESQRAELIVVQNLTTRECGASPPLRTPRGWAFAGRSDKAR